MRVPVAFAAIFLSGALAWAAWVTVTLSHIETDVAVLSTVEHADPRAERLP